MLKTFFGSIPRYVFFIVFFLCLASSSTIKAQGTIIPPLDVDKIVDRLIESYAKVENFRCTLDKFEKLGNKTDYRTYNYFFMRPRLIRMEIIKGKNRGAIAVFKDGKVRVRKGGILPLRLVRNPNHKAVTSLRGGTMLESDWQNIVDKIKDYRKENKLKLVGIESREGHNAYLMEVDDISEDGITKRKLWIDAISFLPLGTEMYEGEILVNAMSYYNVAVNEEMSKDLF